METETTEAKIVESKPLLPAESVIQSLAMMPIKKMGEWLKQRNEFIGEYLEEGTDYAIIDLLGKSDKEKEKSKSKMKPSLLKPGAEKSLIFHLAYHDFPKDGTKEILHENGMTPLPATWNGRTESRFPGVPA